MTRIVRSLFTGVIAIVITIVIVALGALWLLLGTVQGGQWLISQAASFIPGELLVENQDGAVLTGLTASRVVYRNEAFAVELTDIRVDVRLAGLLRKRIVIERATGAAVSIDELHLTDIGLTGYVELRDEFPLAGNLRWIGSNGQISGNGNFSGNLGKLEFTHHVALPASVDVTGVVNAVLTQPSIDAQASFAELPLVVGDDEVIIRDGRVTLTGTVEAFRINANTDLQMAGFAPIEIDIEAFGNTDRLTIETAEAKAFGGRITATGSVGLQDGVTAVRLVGEKLDPAVLQTGLDGRVDFSARIDVGADAAVDIELDTVSGELLARPIEGTGRLLIRGGRIDRVELVARSGRNRLDLSGGSTPEFSGEWRLSAPELSALWPDLDGALEGGGQFSGTPESPVVTVRVDGTQLRFGEFGLDRALLEGRIEADGELAWTVQATDVGSGGLLLGTLHARAHGLLADHRLAVRLSDGAVGVQAEARGAWDGERLQATIESAVIDGGVAGAWVLRDAVLAGLAADNWSIAAHCWSNRPAEICTDGVSRHDGRWVVAATLRHFPLATFDSWLGDDVRIAGEADADLTVDWLVDSFLNADVSWRQGETRLSLSADEASGRQDERAMTLREIQFTLTANDTVAAIEGHATGDFGLTVRASASLDDPLGEDGQLTGRFDAQIPDIGELRPIINRYLLTNSLGGELIVGADISGTLLAPVITGRADLNNGSAGIALNAVELTDANLSIVGEGVGQAGDEGGRALAVEGSVRSGEGLVRIDGQIDWSEARGIFSNLRLTGHDFEVMRLPDRRVVITPDIDLALDDDTIAISGRVLVPEAEFVVQELGETAVTISADVVVHDEQQPARRSTPGPKLIGSLDLQLGDNVSFSGFGIDTRLAGGLKLVETVDTPLAAEGSLQLVDGRYEMLGKILTIEQGSLNFYGPLNDPVLDVRAVREVRYQARNITVGAVVSGRISRQLDFVLFSNPFYSDADILSFLLVDRPAATADGDGSALSGAAVAMGLQSLSVMQEVSQGLNLDEAGLRGSGGDDTEVVAGKRISEDVYVRYTYGLFNRIGTLLIRYDIGRGFSIEAGSGEQQTLDLLYSIDR